MDPLSHYNFYSQTINTMEYIFIECLAQFLLGNIFDMIRFGNAVNIILSKRHQMT